MNSIYLLSDAPDYLKDKDLVKGGLIGNKLKGIQATLPVNNYARTLIRDWLLKIHATFRIYCRKDRRF